MAYFVHMNMMETFLGWSKLWSDSINPLDTHREKRTTPFKQLSTYFDFVITVVHIDFFGQVGNFMGSVGNVIPQVGNLIGQDENLMGQLWNLMGLDGTFVWHKFKVEYSDWQAKLSWRMALEISFKITRRLGGCWSFLTGIEGLGKVEHQRWCW